MLENLQIIYTDLNGFKQYFYQFNDFYQYLEFNSQFPGLFSYEATTDWAKWTVQYNINQNNYVFVEIIDFNTGQKIIQPLAERAIIYPPSGWWLTNPQSYEEILGIYMNAWVRQYSSNFVQYNATTGYWYGIDLVNSKIYLSLDPKDAMRAVITFWQDSDWARLKITY